MHVVTCMRTGMCVTSYLDFNLEICMTELVAISTCCENEQVEKDKLLALGNVFLSSISYVEVVGCIVLSNKAQLRLRHKFLDSLALHIL